MLFGPIGPVGVVLELELWLFEIHDYLLDLEDFGQPMLIVLPWEIKVRGQPDPVHRVLHGEVRVPVMEATMCASAAVA